MANRSKDLVIKKNPKSLFSESIRSIRTNIAFASLDKDVKISINTSPEAGDGKSFVTANLAVAYAQEDKKVLYNCLTGKTTYEKERQKVIAHYRKIYG